MKRLFDIAVALCLLVLLSPVMLCVALLVRIRFGSPVVSRYIRSGRFGKPFEMIKFRTRPDTPLSTQPDHLGTQQPLTRLGSLLRRTHLDELPTLWNVLKGDMSLVGPRPVKMEYLHHYNARQARRHEVRPGLADWAALNLPRAKTAEQALENDVWYIEHRSTWIDTKILAMALANTIWRRPAQTEPQTRWEHPTEKI